jgi:hypothetical protein
MVKKTKCNYSLAIPVSQEAEGAAADVEKAATNEHRRRNELARLIFEWGFEKYKGAGSCDGLIGRRISRRNSLPPTLHPPKLPSRLASHSQRRPM